MTRPTTHRIHLTGRNHTWTAPMSDMQRERAEAPLQPVRREPARGESLRRSIAAVVMFAVSAVSFVLASAWLS